MDRYTPFQAHTMARGSTASTARPPEKETDTAMNRVLNTPELLEMVLVQLDMQTLLTSAQRVCRPWRAFITKSPSLQKILFFTPIKGSSEWGLVIDERSINPLLQEKFPTIFPGKHRKRNPHHEFSFSNLPMTRNDKSMARFLHQDASWRRMLVQQSPAAPSGIGLFYVYHAKAADRSSSTRIPGSKKTQGLRMGQLFDILLFNPKVQFRKHDTVRVYWSVEEPISLDERGSDIIDKFHDALRRFGVVVFARRHMTCRRDTQPTDAERSRQKIVDAYEGGGLGVKEKGN
ncbi:uncharacterized protein BDV14DRAFT_171599 [Aspergillus stella-maris]|uniref:uncharacterized protein n=1 Tax=Aspergillus stella-maris TaxID=1810926 RepID=UPI003CCD5346